MLKLDENTIKNAVNRSYEKRCHVRALSATEFAVRCVNGHQHGVRFEERPNGLYGECFLRETGEMCPSDLGKHVCYHLTSALALYQAMRDGHLASAFQTVSTDTTSARREAPTAPLGVAGGVASSVEQLIACAQIRRVILPNGQAIEKVRGIRI